MVFEIVYICNYVIMMICIVLQEVMYVKDYFIQMMGRLYNLFIELMKYVKYVN